MAISFNPETKRDTSLQRVMWDPEIFDRMDNRFSVSAGSAAKFRQKPLPMRSSVTGNKSRPSEVRSAVGC